MTSSSQGNFADHYFLFFDEPTSHEVHRAEGFEEPILTLRYHGLFSRCTTVATLGFGALSHDQGSDFVEVVLAADHAPETTELLLIRTLFAILHHHIPLREGISVRGLSKIGEDYVATTGKEAFYFTEPFLFPPDFRRPCEHTRVLLAVPISSAEHDLLEARGAEAFESLLAKKEVDPFDILRPSAC
ncbi:MAG: suppressor of fused domain protein [Acidobacteriota bacterium]